jgi:hypothetical protein
LCRAARLSLGLHTDREELALLERRQLRLSIVRACPAGCPRILFVILALKVLERALDTLVDLLEEMLALVRSDVALFGVDRFALAAVDGDEGARAQVQWLAQPRALPADLPQGLQVGLPAVGYRLVIRPQLLPQPHELSLPVGLLFQTSTRPETVEIAIEVELQQIRWVGGRPSRGSGGGPLKAERREVEVVDKGIEETDGMLFSNVVVESLWE